MKGLSKGRYDETFAGEDVGCHARDVTANSHVGQNEIDISTHTDGK